MMKGNNEFIRHAIDVKGNLQSVPNYIEYGEKSLDHLTNYFSIKTIQTIKSANKVLEPHCHTLLYQLVWVTDGSYSVTIDDKIHHLQKNCFLLLYPNTIHATSFEENPKGYSVHFSIDFFEVHEKGTYLSSVIKRSTSKRFLIVKIDKTTSHEINVIFNGMEKVNSGGSFLSDELIRTYLSLSLLKMYEFYGLLDKNTLFTSSQTIVNRFIQAVDANFINKRSVSEYAKILNLSEGHLNHIIKKETGKPAGYHIRKRILHEAQRLLIYTDSSISEISYTLNFSNPSYFFRLFKSLTGTTPKKFRKNHLKEKTIST
jgi:AraC-like DNA-binding protein/quercetin dioxygenase-like cupin family protein